MPLKQSMQLVALSKQLAAMKALLQEHGIALPTSCNRQRRKKDKKVQSSSGRDVKSKGSVDQEATNPASNWTTVKGSSAKEKIDRKGPSDSLEAEGWSVPVVHVLSMEDLKVSTCGVALVGMTVGKRAVLDGFRVEKSLGLLLPVPVPGKEGEGVLMSVLVKDKDSKLQVRQRYLYQLGPEDVRLTSQAPKVDITQDAAKAIIVIKKQFVSNDVWQAVQSRARPAARAWLQNRVGVSVLDIHAPTRWETRPDSIQMVVCVNSVQDQQKVLCASGLDGVWTRLFLEAPSDRERFKTVPLPFGLSLQQAREKGSFLGEMSVGVVTCGKGFGVRVLASNFESVLLKLRPEDSNMFLGKLWEVSGLPCSCWEQALLQLLHGWQVQPSFTFRVGQGLRATRTWIVRAQQEPQTNVLQHTFGLSVVKEYARVPREKQPMQVMKPVAKNHSKQSPLPKTWAGVVASGCGSNPTEKLESPHQQQRRPKRTATEAMFSSTVPAMNMETPQLPPGSLSPQNSCATDLQGQIAQAIAAALQPMMTQVKVMQEEICAMRDADVVVDVSEDERLDGHDGGDDCVATVTAVPSAVPHQRASHSTAKPRTSPY